jgi:hypothetical protein
MEGRGIVGAGVVAGEEHRRMEHHTDREVDRLRRLVVSRVVEGRFGKVTVDCVVGAVRLRCKSCEYCMVGSEVGSVGRMVEMCPVVARRVGEVDCIGCVPNYLAGKRLEAQLRSNHLVDHCVGSSQSCYLVAVAI